MRVAHELGQSVMLDNGAFSQWKTGKPVDWMKFYDWCDIWLCCPTTWAVIPDVIGGGEKENDALVANWPHGEKGAPVWHLDESLDRLIRLSGSWPKICFGSSGEYSEVGSSAWNARVTAAFDELSRRHARMPWVHMLRGMKLAGSHYPFASLDSTNIARNHAGSRTRNRPPKDPRVMADSVDSKQCAIHWIPTSLIAGELNMEQDVSRFISTICWLRDEEPEGHIHLVANLQDWTKLIGVIPQEWRSNWGRMSVLASLQFRGNVDKAFEALSRIAQLVMAGLDSDAEMQTIALLTSPPEQRAVRKTRKPRASGFGAPVRFSEAQKTAIAVLPEAIDPAKVIAKLAGMGSRELRANPSTVEQSIPERMNAAMDQLSAACLELASWAESMKYTVQP